eukprot:1931734-Prymnesium_polylepis.1
MPPKFTFNAASRGTVAAARMGTHQSPARGEGSSHAHNRAEGSVTPKRPQICKRPNSDDSAGPSYLKSTSASAASAHRRAEQTSLDVGEDSQQLDDADSMWTCTKWLASLDLHHLVSAALAPTEVDQYERMKILTRDEITQLLTAAKLEGLVDAVAA